MKKSLVILSISLILLISVSFVSAESFGMRQTSLSYNGFPGLELSWFSELFSGKTSGSAINPNLDLQDPPIKKCGFLCKIFTPTQDEPIPLEGEPIDININEDEDLNGDLLDG